MRVIGNCGAWRYPRPASLPYEHAQEIHMNMLKEIDRPPAPAQSGDGAALKKLVVIGTGYVGLPAALMWAKAGLPVTGVDINENVVRAINEGTMRMNTAELQSLIDD